MRKKLANFLKRKIILLGLFLSLIIFLTGGLLFYFLAENKNISGAPALILFGIVYLTLGVGFYGIGKWLMFNFLRLIINLIRFVLWGNIEVRIVGGKVFFKTFFRK